MKALYELLGKTPKNSSTSIIIKNNRTVIEHKYYGPFNPDVDSEDEELKSPTIEEKKESSSSSSSTSSVESFENAEKDKLKVWPLEAKEQMSVLDQNGYRAIWTSLTQKDALGIETSSHRVRMKEEKAHNSCMKANSYYEKLINHIETMSTDKRYMKSEHISLNNKIKQIFTEVCLRSNKITKNAKKALEFVKSIVGEQYRLTLLEVLIFSIIQAVRKRRDVIYSHAKDLTESLKADDVPGKKFRCLMLRPYREYRSTYMQFLESFLTGIEIMEKASEALNPVFVYLVENTTIEKTRINLIQLGKIM